MNKNKIHIMLSGGGTGGHIFPAVAIADGLKSELEGAEFLFVGAIGRMEMEKVPQSGYEIVGLPISGIQRKMTLQNLWFPFKLITSLLKAKNIIKQFKPDVVIGTGGYASGPLLYMAAGQRIPTLILEQNSYPGLTNKWLAGRVNRICVGYPGMEKYFPNEKIVLTGSPIRKEITHTQLSKAEACAYFGLNPSLPVLLVIGGSQGARPINEALGHNLDSLLLENIQIVWQTGKTGLSQAQAIVGATNGQEKVVVKDFIRQMEYAYACADVVVSRAGAIAIAEIIAVRKPTILIPLPGAAEDHQTRNARTLSDNAAGILIPESQASAKLANMVIRLIMDSEKRKEMATNLALFDHQDPTKAIVDQVVQLINANKK